MDFLNKPILTYLVQHAKQAPTKTAIHYYGKQISYEELLIDINKMARYLKKNGVKKGDTVTLFLQNCPQYFISFFAIQQLGAIVGPCNPMFKQFELQYQLQDLEAVMLITTPDLYNIYLQIENQTNVQTVILTSYQDYLPEKPFPEFPEQISSVPENYAHAWNQILLETERELQQAEIDLKNDVSLIIYTSGTTGNPKGAMLSFGNSEYEAYAVAKNFAITHEDIMISVMPICHIAGKLVGMLSAMIAGATVVLLARFDKKTMSQSIDHYKVTFLYTTTPMNVQMLQDDILTSIKTNHLRMNITTSFGIQLTKDISDAWEAAVGIPIMEFAYGMSETHTGNTLMPPHAIKYGTVGKVTEGTEVIIVDPDNYDHILPPKRDGLILVKGPSVFKGYKGREAETKVNFHGDYFITGDIGKIDEEGYLYFLGRLKEMIKCSGYSVYPEEVEKILTKHPAVNQVAVIGIPDEVRGESVKAFIVKNKGEKAAAEEIIQWAKEHMSAYKYPREIEFIEELPKTNSGKILRRKLKTTS